MALSDVGTDAVARAPFALGEFRCGVNRALLFPRLAGIATIEGSKRVVEKLGVAESQSSGRNCLVLPCSPVGAVAEGGPGITRAAAHNVVASPGVDRVVVVGGRDRVVAVAATGAAESNRVGDPVVSALAS